MRRVIVLALLGFLGAESFSISRRGDNNTIAQIPRLEPAHEYKVGMKDEQDGVSKREYDHLEDKYNRLRSKKGGGAEEGAEGEGEEEGEGDHAGHTFALGMVSTVVILAVTFGMASLPNKEVSGLTWGIIDNVVAIFFAVLCFQAFDDFLDFSSITGNHEVAAGFLHCVALLGLALYLSWLLNTERTKVQLAVFCGCVAHFVSFASMHASKEAQEKFFNHSAYTETAAWMFVGMLVLVVVFAVIGFVVHQIKKHRGLLEADEWDEKVTDIENDFAAMGVSVAWSLYVRFLISGHYHELDKDIGEGAPQTSYYERLAMLIYACLMLVCTVIAIRGLDALQGRAQHSICVKRCSMFASSFFTMSVAWALLLWGEWEFIDYMYHGHPITGRLFFAMLSSMIIAVCVLLLAYLTPRASHLNLEHAKRVALIAMSLVVGWSWEACFDEAIESLVEESAHPVYYKVGLAIGMGCFILPVYIGYLKPIVISKTVE